MKLLTGILLTVGLFFQAIDILLAPSQKDAIRLRFLALSSLMQSFSTRDIVKWVLIGFSSRLDRWLGPAPFGFRSLRLLLTLHFFVLLFVGFLTIAFHVFYPASWTFPIPRSYFDTVMVANLHRMAPAFVVPDYSDVLTTLHRLLPVVAATWLVSVLSVSCLSSYASLGMTRFLLQHVINSRTRSSLAAFISIDCSVAILLTVLLSFLTIMLPAFLLWIVTPLYLSWTTELTPDTIGFYTAIINNWFLYNLDAIDISNWPHTIQTYSEMLDVLWAMPMWKLVWVIYDGLLTKFIIDIKHVAALEWLQIDFASTTKNWAWTFTLLPSIAYLVLVGGAQLTARLSIAQQGVAALLTWLARRDKGPLYVLGWVVLAIFAVIRFWVL